jgi:hypothetical protein
LGVLGSIQRQGAEAPLREGWAEAYDHSREATYYYHQDTRMVSWVRPTDADPEAEAPDEAETAAQAGSVGAAEGVAYADDGDTSGAVAAAEVDVPTGEDRARAPAPTAAAASTTTLVDTSAQIGAAVAAAAPPPPVLASAPTAEESAPLTVPSIAVLHEVFERYCLYGLSQMQRSATVPPELDAQRFSKLIAEAGLTSAAPVGGRLGTMTAAQVDLCFNCSLPRGARRIGFETFMRRIIPACAQACFATLPPEQGVQAVELALSRAMPQHHASVVHDSKDRGSMIEAAQAAALQRMAEHELCEGLPVQKTRQDERDAHEQLMHRVLPADTDERLRTMFDGFCSFGKSRAAVHGSAHAAPAVPLTLDNVHFAKLGRDCGLVDSRNLTSNRMDLIFARALDHGARSLTFKTFIERAVPLLAQHKFANASADEFGDEDEKVRKLIGMLLACEGPRIVATRHTQKGGGGASSPQVRAAARKHFRTSRFEK